MAEQGVKKIVDLFMEKRIDFSIPVNKYSKKPIDVAKSSIKSDLIKYQARLKERQEIERRKATAIPCTLTASPSMVATTSVAGNALVPSMTNAPTTRMALTPEQTVSVEEMEKIVPEEEKNVLAQLDASAKKPMMKFYEIATEDDETYSSSKPSVPSNVLDTNQKELTVSDADRELDAMLTQIAEAAWDITWSKDAYSSFRKLDSFAKKVVLRRLISLAQGERYPTAILVLIS